jgi:hypothetical protein
MDHKYQFDDELLVEKTQVKLTEVELIWQDI